MLFVGDDPELGPHNARVCELVSSLGKVHLAGIKRRANEQGHLRASKRQDGHQFLGQTLSKKSPHPIDAGQIIVWQHFMSLAEVLKAMWCPVASLGRKNLGGFLVRGVNTRNACVICVVY